MINMAHSTTNENGTKASNYPRAVVHKKILDEAKTSPKASIEEIAENVSGASADLVERVLEGYGDPAESNSDLVVEDDSADTRSNSASGGSLGPRANDDTLCDSSPNPDELTHKQLITLRAIFDNPQATQVEIAEQLDVTNVTVCNRVNDIDSFDWRHREEFVNKIFGDENPDSKGNQLENEQDKQPERTKGQIEKDNAHKGHGDSLGQTLDKVTFEDIFTDSDLAAKVIRACIRSDQITKGEELKIIKAVLSLNDPID
jgi:hypothetical protein